MPTAIRSQHFVLERLLKKVVRERWPETFGRAHAPIDTGSEQINRLSQGRLRTPCATRGGPLRASPELGHRTGAARLRLLGACLRRFSWLLRGFNGRDPRCQGGDDPAILTVSLV